MIRIVAVSTLKPGVLQDYLQAVAELIESRFPKLTGKVMINSVGTVIGSHTGPGTGALFFWGVERVD